MKIALSVSADPYLETFPEGEKSTGVSRDSGENRTHLTIKKVCHHYLRRLQKKRGEKSTQENRASLLDLSP